MDSKTKHIIIKDKIEAIINWMYVAIMLILIISLVTNMIYNHKTGSKTRSIMGYYPTVVVSGSMVPTLEVYSMTLVKDCEIDEVEIGDIIIYDDTERNISIIHRVIDRKEIDGEIYLETKGDHNERSDGFKTNKDNIKGKVKYIWNWTAPIFSMVLVPGTTTLNMPFFIVLGAMTVVGVWFIIFGTKWIIYMAILALVNIYYGIKNRKHKQ